MEVREGYKKTEVGVIPGDWEVKPLEYLCKPSGLVRGPFGGALKKEYFVKSGYKVYEQRNAIYKNPNIGNYYINKDKFDELARFAVKQGDFIISCSGTIGKIFQIPKNYKQGVINQALLKLTIDSSKAVDKFFEVYFSWDRFQDKIIDSTQGGAMKNLVGMDVFKKTLVAIPPIPEQQAIAAALSDVDDLISSLTKLINKKKSIMQGAMQELLTGKKRLDGFSGDWDEIKLGMISKINTGKKNNDDKVSDGIYPFFVRSKQIERIDTYSFDGEAIIIPGEGNIGEIFHYINGKFDYHQRVYKISNFPTNIYAKYVFYYIAAFFGEYALKNTVKATVDSLRLPTFEEFIINVPKTIQEQTAIASNLSDMDAEIEALEQKLNKYKAIKQGMMHELLTGRIRLV